MNIVQFINKAFRKVFRLIVFGYKNAESKLRAKNITSKGGTINIELGSCINRSGYYTIDLNPGADLVLNLLKPLPFPNNCVQQAYSSHMLEHFCYIDLIKLLKEIYRVLKPGGMFFIVVPDASIFIRGYIDFAHFDLERNIGKTNPYLHFFGKIDIVNYVAYTDEHHKFMFDEENLLNILKFVGFTDACLREFDPGLDLEVRRYVSIHAIAIK